MLQFKICALILHTRNEARFKHAPTELNSLNALHTGAPAGGREWERLGEIGRDGGWMVECECYRGSV